MKILVIRFSSIGDIVLTTPILRAIKQQLSGVELHYLTKKQFSSLIEGNPYVDKVFSIEKDIDEVKDSLRKEDYDRIIDLHNNLRTFRLKRLLRKSSFSLDKLNFKKLLLVKFKIDRMPDLHVVDRYFDVLKGLGVRNDRLPGDFTISDGDKVDVKAIFGLERKEFYTMAIGAQFATKRLPVEKLKEILALLDLPVVIVGGPMDFETGEELVETLPDKMIFNTCGEYSIHGSASIVQQSKKLLTNDTGMMHIAACLNVPIVSVWGNTVPEFGMYPYYPGQKEMYSIHEVEGLSCRPCSKIGYQKCPKGHFKCMLDQNTVSIAEDLMK